VFSIIGKLNIDNLPQFEVTILQISKTIYEDKK